VPFAVIEMSRSNDDNLSELEAPSFLGHLSEASNPDNIENSATQLGNLHVDVTTESISMVAYTRKVEQQPLSRASSRHSPCSPPKLDKLRESILDINHDRPVFVVGLLGGSLCLVAGYVNAVCILLYTGGASHATGILSKTAIAAIEQQVRIQIGIVFL